MVGSGFFSVLLVSGVHGVRGKYVNLENPSDTRDNNARGVAYKNSGGVVSQVADSERPVSPT
jgi:hypothetical protein